MIPQAMGAAVPSFCIGKLWNDKLDLAVQWNSSYVFQYLAHTHSGHMVVWAVLLIALDMGTDKATGK